MLISSKHSFWIGSIQELLIYQRISSAFSDAEINLHELQQEIQHEYSGQAVHHFRNSLPIAGEYFDERVQYKAPADAVRDVERQYHHQHHQDGREIFRKIIKIDAVQVIGRQQGSHNDEQSRNNRQRNQGNEGNQRDGEQKIHAHHKGRQTAPPSNGNPGCAFRTRTGGTAAQQTGSHDG